MKLTKLFIIAGAFLVFNCTNRNDKIAVNQEASPEVIELLNNLYTWKGKHILSGQHNYSRPGELMRSYDTVVARTGKVPVIWGSDFGGNRHREIMINQAIEMHRKGHIITLMYHQDCPVDTMPANVPPVRYKMSADEWKDLITPGTRFNMRWLEDIDRVAKWLKVLQDEKIPVLWRPYHEMNGMWFWWGNQQGEKGIQELWKQMYTRFTHHHKLNNLIWVWNANAPRDWENDEAYAYELFYPGPQYADILAADIYKGDYKQSHHDDLLALANGKPIALGEIGEGPDPAIFGTQTEWSWFMMWAHWTWTHNTPEELNALYNAPKVINFDEFAGIK